MCTPPHGMLRNMLDACAMLAIVVLLVMSRSVPLVLIPYTAMGMRLVATALVEVSVTIQEALARASLASSELDASTKPLSCNHSSCAQSASLPPFPSPLPPFVVPHENTHLPTNQPTDGLIIIIIIITEPQQPTLAIGRS